MKKINAYADTDNVASRKVLEKVGFTFLETFEYEGAVEAWYKAVNTNL